LKEIETDLWLSNKFPLKFPQLMEVFDTLSLSGNANMKKMCEFLNDDCLKEVITSNGFPVKVQIPVGMIIKATVSFTKFRFLDEQNVEEEVFKIPSDYRHVPRKEGMKTLQSKKKRLAVANVIS